MWVYQLFVQLMCVLCVPGYAYAEAGCIAMATAAKSKRAWGFLRLHVVSHSSPLQCPLLSRSSVILDIGNAELLGARGI